jgi:hypothetical protein
MECRGVTGPAALLVLLAIASRTAHACQAHSECGVREGRKRWCDDTRRCRPCDQWDDGDLTASVTGKAPKECAPVPSPRPPRPPPPSPLPPQPRPPAAPLPLQPPRPLQALSPPPPRQRSSPQSKATRSHSRSTRSCSELKWQVPESEAVCGASSMGGCLTAATYLQAASRCAEQGARLCSPYELMQVTVGTGCGYDADKVKVWAVDSCGDAGSHQVVLSRKPEEWICASDQSFHAVRCCADDYVPPRRAPPPPPPASPALPPSPAPPPPLRRQRPHSPARPPPAPTERAGFRPKNTVAAAARHVVPLPPPLASPRPMRAPAPLPPPVLVHATSSQMPSSSRSPPPPPPWWLERHKKRSSSPPPSQPDDVSSPPPTQLTSGAPKHQPKQQIAHSIVNGTALPKSIGGATPPSTLSSAAPKAHAHPHAADTDPPSLSWWDSWPGFYTAAQHAWAEYASLRRALVKSAVGPSRPVSEEELMVVDLAFLCGVGLIFACFLRRLARQRTRKRSYGRYDFNDEADALVPISRSGRLTRPAPSYYEISVQERSRMRSKKKPRREGKDWFF